MQKLLITAVLFVFCLGGIAHADGMYVKGNIGIFMPENADLAFEFEDGDDVDYGEISSKTGFGMTAAVGHSFGAFDLELEYGYREAAGDEITYEEGAGFYNDDTDQMDTIFDLEGSLDIKTFMVNAIYNFENSTSLTPYLGAGFGGAWVEVEEANIRNTKLAYQLMAGVGVEVTKNASLLLGYRYLGMGDLSGTGASDYIYDLNGVSTVGYYSGPSKGSADFHNIEVGLKYSF